MEEYRDIPGYEGKYQVSDLGNVKSLERRIRGALRRERVMKLSPNGRGYLKVSFRDKKILKTYSIHKLVAIVFLNHTPCGMKLVVDHINGNKLDNRLENLQVISNRQNSWKEAKGSSDYRGVSWCKPNSNWKAQIGYNGKQYHLGNFKTEIEAHECYTNFCIKNKIIY